MVTATAMAIVDSFSTERGTMLILDCGYGQIFQCAISRWNIVCPDCGNARTLLLLLEEYHDH